MPADHPPPSHPPPDSIPRLGPHLPCAGDTRSAAEQRREASPHDLRDLSEDSVGRWESQGRGLSDEKLGRSGGVRQTDPPATSGAPPRTWMSIDLWACRYMNLWIYGSMDLWACRYMDVWISPTSIWAPGASSASTLSSSQP